MRTYKTRAEILQSLRDIPGYEGLYAASEAGQIWSYRRYKFLKISNGNHGYKQVNLVNKFGEKKNEYAHRLVALAYIDNPDNLPEVNHRDEDKANNAVSNLEWCDRLYNLQYSKIGANKKVYCVELDKTFDSMKEASEYTGANVSSISGCCIGRYKTAGKMHWRYAE